MGITSPPSFSITLAHSLTVGRFQKAKISFFANNSENENGRVESVALPLKLSNCMNFNSYFLFYVVGTGIALLAIQLAGCME
ncbi:hypothetical protein FJ444_08105 [Aestuariibacter sp. GS-14]|uniref:hypothetical protein n=1 Tax=Alteromonadaceae TaxID=72275 RepID=UPI00112CDD6A|nr:hypothetical protein [Aestuariibacter sp. GS-14]TPV59011.1 hypothetical protein FJ444_08105 [Aestuariibacter sp. GS-14]